MAEKKQNWKEQATSEDNIKICADCTQVLKDLRLGNDKSDTFKIVKGDMQEIKVYKGGKKEMEAAKKAQQSDRLQ